jgi:hypothetical protein
MYRDDPSDDDNYFNPDTVEEDDDRHIVDSTLKKGCLEENNVAIIFHLPSHKKMILLFYHRNGVMSTRPKDILVFVQKQFRIGGKINIC